jgi:transmembrane sensor
VTINKDQFDIKELAEKWATGKLSEEESSWLEKWYAGFDDTKVHVTGSRHPDSEALRSAMLNNIRTELKIGKRPVAEFFSFKRVAIAASVILFSVVCAYYFLPKEQPSYTASLIKNDLAPGSNKAILTLSNGKQIFLDGSKSGHLGTEGSTMVNKTDSGSISYLASGKSPLTAIVYNTMTTPKGGQYSVVLADGTKVVLNAGSSITYPVIFTGSERKVKLTGEAYFEVAHNKLKPFHVETKDQDVQVLGTHFNINAYTEETSTRTTLLEGSVKVSLIGATSESLVLVPGQQAVVHDAQMTRLTVDAEDATAWKDGLFVFDNETLEHALVKISRWYDLQVVYEDEAARKITVGGSVSRFERVSGLLHLFERSGKVHFKLSGKTLTVTR